MGGINRIQISGTLLSVEKVRLTNFPSCKAQLEIDSSRFLVVPLFAPNDAAAELTLFKEGDNVIVIGHLSSSPAGEFQIVVQSVKASTPKPVHQCSHHMNIPQSVGSSR